MPRAFITAVIFWALACSRPREPAPLASREPETAAPTVPTTSPPAGLPSAWRLPLGWRWLTSLEAGFTVAYPGLPTVDTPMPGTQRLVARTERGEFAVGVAPEGDPAERYRRDITAQGWRIEGDRMLAGSVRSLDVSNGPLITHTRLVPSTTRTFVLTATSRVGDDGDANTFLDSFAPSARLENRALHHVRGGFSIVAPGRMSDWEEHSADPPIRGYSGLIDGVQFGAAFSDLDATALVENPSMVLQRGAAASLAQLGGVTITRSESPFRGHPSLRLEHRGADGVYVTRRTVVAHGRLYDLGVYAAGGIKPAWADAFVDSLTLDP